MNKSAIHERVAGELLGIPRGGPSQNLYRAAYEQARLNALGHRPQVGDDPSEAHRVALSAVREVDAGFLPTLS